MNVTDVEESNQDVPNTLSAIFARQKELMGKYHAIEKASGLMQTEDCPVELDTPKGQARLKDFAWRATEEIAEAMEDLIGYDPTVDVLDHVHIREELADALHFLVELMILADVESKELLDGLDDLSEAMRELGGTSFTWTNDKPTATQVVGVFATAGAAVTTLGVAMNCLKLKPWKQAHVATDRVKFVNALKDSFWMLICLMSTVGMSGKAVASYYFRKAKVNAFRQESNY